MRGREVPFGIALADGEDAAVPHVDGDQDLFALVGCDGSLAQDHLLRVDIVVDGMEALDPGQTGSLQQDLRHELTAPAGKGLADLHVMEVILQILAVHEAQVLGDGRITRFPLESLERCLDLLPAPGSLVLRDQGVTPGKVFLLAPVQIDGQALVVFRHLLAQVAGAGVDHETAGAVRGAVDLDEVVAAAQGAQAAFQPLRILQRAEAAQPCQVKALLPALPHAHAGGDAVGRLVHALHVDIAPAERDRVHAAADIHTDDVGDDLVPDRHGRADGAALPGVDVGHDADPAPGGDLIIAHSADLLDGLVLDDAGKADRRIHLSFDFHHGVPPLPACKKPPAPIRQAV